MSTTTWQEFERQLAGVLGVLENGQYLVVAAKRGWAYVQFAVQAGRAIRAEAVSNRFIPSDQHLSDADTAALAALGWTPPADPVPNFHQDWMAPVTMEAAAHVAVRTLREVHKVEHPDQLLYKAFDKANSAILLPTLGLDRTPSKPRAIQPDVATVKDVRRRVLKSLRAAWGAPELDFTGEHDRIEVQFGSAIMFIRVLADPLSVSVASPLLLHVSHQDGLLERVNDLNRRLRFAHVFVADDTVCAELEVSAAPFVEAHVMQACERLGRLADTLDDLLQDEFGGRTAFGEFRATERVH